jgi:hypothetical protein
VFTICCGMLEYVICLNALIVIGMIDFCWILVFSIDFMGENLLIYGVNL